ncbi:MAG: PIN domain-containing protein [Candidatus Hydrothermarchaeaceae archaeon]
MPRNTTQGFVLDTSAITRGWDLEEALGLSGEAKKEFGAKYRNALGCGTMDPALELDVLIRTKGMNAGMATRDKGVGKWADDLGFEFVEGSSFPMMLKEYLRHAEKD